MININYSNKTRVINYIFKRPLGAIVRTSRKIKCKIFKLCTLCVDNEEKLCYTYYTVIRRLYMEKICDFKYNANHFSLKLEEAAFALSKIHANTPKNIPLYPLMPDKNKEIMFKHMI